MNGRILPMVAFFNHLYNLINKPGRSNPLSLRLSFKMIYFEYDRYKSNRF